MPSLPHLPLRTLVSKAADVQVSAASMAFRLAGHGAGQLRRHGLPQAVGAVVGAGVSGVTTVVGALAHRGRSETGQREQTPTGPARGSGAAPETGTAETETGTASETGRPRGTGTASGTGTGIEPSASGREAVAAGAPGAATDEADAAEQEAVEHGVVVEVVDHDDLPIPSYDEKTVGSLRARLQRLDVDQLIVLRAYEQAHAHRLQVLTMIENRIAKLHKQQAAAQSDTGPG